MNIDLLRQILSKTHLVAVSNTIEIDPNDPEWPLYAGDYKADLIEDEVYLSAADNEEKVTSYTIEQLAAILPDDSIKFYALTEISQSNTIKLIVNA